MVSGPACLAVWSSTALPAEAHRLLGGRDGVGPRVSAPWAPVGGGGEGGGGPPPAAAGGEATPATSAASATPAVPAPAPIAPGVPDPEPAPPKANVQAAPRRKRMPLCALALRAGL